MIVTSWRSGSTLTGELLNSVPGSYYSYEPLSFVGINRIYNSSQKDLIQSSLNVIKGIFKCNYSMVERECKFLELNVLFKDPNKRVELHVLEIFPQFHVLLSAYSPVPN